MYVARALQLRDADRVRLEAVKWRSGYIEAGIDGLGDLPATRACA